MRITAFLICFITCSQGICQGTATHYSGNTTVFTAVDLCNPGLTWVPYSLAAAPTLTFIDQSFDLSGSPYALGGQTTLYYKARSNSYTPNLEPNNNLFRFNGHGTNITPTIYGPFDNDAAAETEVANGTAPLYPVTLNGEGSFYNILGAQSDTKVFIIKIKFASSAGLFSIGRTTQFGLCDPPAFEPCEDCLPTFHPMNKDFVISAWVREDDPNAMVLTTYTRSKLIVDTGFGPVDFYPSGQIIDGWQRIEGVFRAYYAGDISVSLKATSTVDVYFDDIRIFPKDGSMVSYVYDPRTKRLVAELDERNYAKLYEYDEEGKLVRVKKETAQGIMTIQESRENSFLKPN